MSSTLKTCTKSRRNTTTALTDKPMPIIMRKVQGIANSSQKIDKEKPTPESTANSDSNTSVTPTDVNHINVAAI